MWTRDGFYIISIQQDPSARGKTSVTEVVDIDQRAGGCPAVVAQWQSTGGSSQVSWVQLPATAGFFTFLYFRLIIKFIYFQREARCSEQQEWNLGELWILQEVGGKKLHSITLFSSGWTGSWRSSE